MQYVEYIYENANNYAQTHCINTGILHTASTMSVRLKYYSRGGNSDRMAGYQEGDTGCSSDSNDFRIFGYQNGTFDYKSIRQRIGTINTNNTLYDITFGDCYAYDNINETYLYTGSPTGEIPSQNCPIYVDVSLIKVVSISIYDGNNLLYEGKAALNNGVYGLYDSVGHTFATNNDITINGGAILSSIDVVPSKTSLADTGETINIVVDCENAWTVTGDTWISLSSTGDTGGTTITATAPSYTGATARTDTLTFTDSVTGDEAEITIKQKKYSTGQPFYLGGDEITEIYLGDDTISEAYLGEVLVFSTGPFQGLKLSPKSLKFDSNTLSGTLKVKSSEAWTATTPAWVTASVLTGDTGETTITLTTTAQTATTSGSIVVTSANYEMSASCEYSLGTPMLQIDGRANIGTQFNPFTAYTGNSNYLKFQIIAEWTGSKAGSAYLYEVSPVVFSVERFTSSDNPYCSIGSSYGVSYGPANGGGLNHNWIVEINERNVVTYIDGTQTESRSFNGSVPNGNLIFAGNNATNLHINFYGLRFWGANNTLLADFAPDPSGGIIDKVSNTIYPKTGTGTTAYSLELNS